MLDVINSIYKDIKVVRKSVHDKTTKKTPSIVKEEREEAKRTAYIDIILSYVNKKGPILQSDVLNILEDQVPRYTCGVLLRRLIKDGLIHSVKVKSNYRMLTGVENGTRQ